MVLLGLTRSYESLWRHTEHSENKRYLTPPCTGSLAPPPNGGGSWGRGRGCGGKAETLREPGLHHLSPNPSLEKSGGDAVEAQAPGTENRKLGGLGAPHRPAGPPQMTFNRWGWRAFSILPRTRRAVHPSSHVHTWCYLGCALGMAQAVTSDRGPPRSVAQLSLEKPIETAILLSLVGVGSILANQWPTLLQDNALRASVLWESEWVRLPQAATTPRAPQGPASGAPGQSEGCFFPRSVDSWQADRESRPSPSEDGSWSHE